MAFIIFLFVFSKGKLPITIDVIYTLSFLLVLAIPTCVNFYVLIPRLLQKEHYIYYATSFIVNLIFFAFLSSLLLEPLLDILFNNYFFISYLSEFNIFLVFTIFLTATTLIKLAEDWFHFNTIENNALKQKNLKIETELKALRSQINPHFLFNSLNVIYALALEKKEGTVEAIVQLSDILRYVIYDANTERVSLKEELDLLKNYIAFQSHRTKTAVTTLNIEIEDDTFKIYPMLLLPLIENSYKHSIYDDEASHAITIKIWQSGLDFNFSITNAKSETKNQHNKDRSGVGIQNIKTNLDLVYPGRYDFEINETSKIFQVNLALKNEN
ncbi:MAG: hypothetical protein Wins2KO_09660 [Winogradskyella sp.]